MFRVLLALMFVIVTSVTTQAQSVAMRVETQPIMTGAELWLEPVKLDAGRRFGWLARPLNGFPLFFVVVWHSSSGLNGSVAIAGPCWGPSFGGPDMGYTEAMTMVAQDGDGDGDIDLVWRTHFDGRQLYVVQNLDVPAGCR